MISPEPVFLRNQRAGPSLMATPSNKGDPQHDQPEPEPGPAKPEARPAAAGWRSKARSATAGSEPPSGRKAHAEARSGPLIRALAKAKGPAERPVLSYRGSGRLR